MAKNSSREFPRGPIGGNFIYGWKPDTEITKKQNDSSKVKLVGCFATPASQGVDNDVTYIYDAINVDGVINRIAYVACDYVE